MFLEEGIVPATKPITESKGLAIPGSTSAALPSYDFFDNLGIKLVFVVEQNLISV